MEIPKYDYYWQYVDYWSGVDPDFPSLREGDRTVTAREFKERVDALAGAFLELGVMKGDRIVTIIPTGIDFVLTMVAGEKTGAVTVPMDVKFRTADLERFLSHAKPKLILSITGVKDFDVVAGLKKLGGEFASIPKILVGSGEFGRSFEELFELGAGREADVNTRAKALSPEDGAMIIFTGGTTGVPKAALLSHINMIGMSYIEDQFFKEHLGPYGMDGRVKSLAALPPSHIGGTVELIGMPIVGGHEMILLSDWHPYRVLEVTQDEKIAWMGGVPTMYAILLSLPDLEKYDLSHVKAAILSGEKVSFELAEGITSRLAEVLINGYGSTEAGAEITFTLPGEDLQRIADGYVGKPLPGVALRIVDEKGSVLPQGETGEIQVGGPLVIPEYFNMPEENEAGFTEDGWCITGDLGYLDSDGGLFIKGRIKQIIRVGSYTVLPTEVEEVALEYENVGLTAAIGCPDNIYGEVVWLYVAPVWGTEVDTDGLLEFLKGRLAKFKVPKKIIIKDDIPLTRIGKADRTKLKKDVLAQTEA
ncbi:MAG: acyl--CoA ligase [Deltaproteobacteria bacterium]|nr:acyl--CoA ligase [Candidatus Zymogenaceae bacterium]